MTDRSNDVVHVFDVSQTGGLPAAMPDASVAVGDDPWGIAITSDGSTVVVACEDDQSVHFIDTATLTASSLALPAGSQARDVEISFGDAAAYVPSGNLPGDDPVYVIDLSTQVHTSSITLTGAQNAT